MPNPLPAPPREPLVLIENTCVDIEGHRILTGVDVAIRSHEHLGIVGANGSGKSTLLRLIEGTLWPAPGAGTRRYDFGDGPQTDAIQARTRIVTVGPELQNRYARFGWNFRLLDILRSGISRTDIPQRRPAPGETEAAARIADDLGLTALRDRRFLELSRGQQRRTLIARAIGFAPQLLLLDEPASGLDTAAREALNRLLNRIATRTTLVVSAHSPDDLPAILDRVVFVQAGRVSERPTATVARTDDTPSADAGPVIDGAGPSTAARTDAMPPAAPERPASPLIVVSSASVYYAGRAVLKSVDWSLRPGEHWLIFGHNGSGKSTFLRLLHGQLRSATGGVVTWPGLGNPADVWTLRRQVGLVSAELMAGYRYPVSVRECIGSGIESSHGLTRRLSDAEIARVDALIERFDLRSLAARRLTALSYGQMHRTMIARTLVNAPRVLLLDEPWEGLDPDTRALVARNVTQAMHDGTQVICATHVHQPGIDFNRRATITDGVLSDARDSA